MCYARLPPVPVLGKLFFFAAPLAACHACALCVAVRPCGSTSCSSAAYPQCRGGGEPRLACEVGVEDADKHDRRERQKKQQERATKKKCIKKQRIELEREEETKIKMRKKETHKRQRKT